jgi:hypothetical protein
LDPSVFSFWLHPSISVFLKRIIRLPLIVFLDPFVQPSGLIHPFSVFLKRIHPFTIDPFWIHPFSTFWLHPSVFIISPKGSIRLPLICWIHPFSTFWLHPSVFIISQRIHPFAIDPFFGSVRLSTFWLHPSVFSYFQNGSIRFAIDPFLDYPSNLLAVIRLFHYFPKIHPFPLIRFGSIRFLQPSSIVSSFP